MGFVRCLDDTNKEKGIVVKEMIKKVREDRSGFTLAELLIVVAIILVLVAVAVPVFTGAMDSANRSVGYSAGHAVKSEASAKYLLDNSVADKTVAVTYYATVDKNGNVTNVTTTVDADATPVDNLTDDTALTLGQAISGSDDPTPVSVTIQGADISK